MNFKHTLESTEKGKKSQFGNIYLKILILLLIAKQTMPGSDRRPS